MKRIGSLMVVLATLIFGLPAQAGEVTQYTKVISGKFSRAGSTGRQQYSDAALTQLCNQGYTMAIFLYPGARPRTITCGGGRKITYLSKTPYSSPAGILATTKAEMDRGGKVLVHCWYGVHAAKYVAAAALNNFCGYNGSQSADYFKRGIPPGSLSVSRIEQLASRLRAYPSGGSVAGGCPSP